MFPSIPLFDIVSQPFKRSQLGLFQGKTKQYGNNVPFSKHKTRRTWLPNVQRKRLFSDTLGEEIRVKLTTRALRTIKKHGGLDNYVEKSSHKILGWEGMRIRLKVRDHPQSSESLVATNSANNIDTPNKVMSAVREVKERRLAQVMARSELRSIAYSSPTAQDAQQTREHVMKELGLQSTPTYVYATPGVDETAYMSSFLYSAEQTIAFLKQHRKNLVKGAQFN
ncbi:hypothetical protein H0H81_005694 [Sphagnurus paluster]|uniref:Large ribosomal subunit protein bL28c n=1 Tax=Sphagnurus paluster TaxID=117069 RepID=A0A9P7FXS3_9AGAR|nr:hypothetical protein H0H81_005694 [Sphagnurus paluster]